jgi:LemA protein
MIFFAIIIVIVFLLIWMVSIYNKLIRMIEAVNNNEKQIDIQLDRRFKIFESLINTVKKYMDYEQTVLKDVVALRSQSVSAQQSGDVQSRIEAENKISKISSGINVLVEAYPDLKANQNVLQLQEEIVNTENKLAFAKQALNDSIEAYYASKKSFFEAFVVSFFSASLDKVFTYWNLTPEKIQENENYTVKF